MAAVNSLGITPNNRYDRYNFNIRNTSSFLNDRMTLDLNAGYVRQTDRNMVNQGVAGNPLVGALLYPRGNSWDDVTSYEHYNAERKLNTQYWPVGDYGCRCRTRIGSTTATSARTRRTATPWAQASATRSSTALRSPGRVASTTHTTTTRRNTTPPPTTR